MNQYIATFHTHVSALITTRTLTQNGISARMAPVPRKLSSSCGTCILYAADDPQQEKMDRDVEHIYRISPQNQYELLFQNL
ncbi:MAG: DUF3343 domain-containing protein [Oscillibacter sp.]|jgi:hypothetical protein|nr:DUF3343 domain-containing protein [Oscillibacter sp.]